jgi:hypothetical protein
LISATGRYVIVHPDGGEFLYVFLSVVRNDGIDSPGPDDQSAPVDLHRSPPISK